MAIQSLAVKWKINLREIIYIAQQMSSSQRIQASE